MDSKYTIKQGGLYMNPKHFDENYWSYYLNLESDFITTQRYVTINEDNFYTFSLEYVKQYQAICSEIDVVCKQYCLHLDGLKETSNIKEYANIVLREKPNIKSQTVSIRNQSNIQLTPWKDWSIPPKYISPTWWSAYNKVKHNRTSLDNDTGQGNYKKANLENTLNALAGLLVIEMLFYKDLVEAEGISDMTIPCRPSSLLKMDDWEKHISIGNNFITVEYDGVSYPEILTAYKAREML